MYSRLYNASFHRRHEEKKSEGQLTTINKNSELVEYNILHSALMALRNFTAAALNPAGGVWESFKWLELAGGFPWVLW